MRWVILAAVVVAACGGTDQAGIRGDPLFCYDYTADPSTGLRATYCTDTKPTTFCWYTGRSTVTIGNDVVECCCGGVEAGCRRLAYDEPELFGCVKPGCWPNHIDNDACCNSGQVRYRADGSEGAWDHAGVADCI